MNVRNHRLIVANSGLREDFLQGMSQTAATVNVVITDGPAGRAGVTVSAMSSVSADTSAPLLLVCVHKSGSACQAILENGVFCVNVLRDDQSHISDVFAGRTENHDGDRFSCAEWVAQQSGVPRLANPLVAFDCRLVKSELAGTHHVLFGAVQETFVNSFGTPLIYADRSYNKLAARI